MKYAQRESQNEHRFRCRFWYDVYRYGLNISVACVERRTNSHPKTCFPNETLGRIEYQHSVRGCGHVKTICGDFENGFVVLNIESRKLKTQRRIRGRFENRYIAKHRRVVQWIFCDIDLKRLETVSVPSVTLTVMSIGSVASPRAFNISTPF